MPPSRLPSRLSSLLRALSLPALLVLSSRPPREERAMTRRSARAGSPGMLSSLLLEGMAKPEGRGEKTGCPNQVTGLAGGGSCSRSGAESTGLGQLGGPGAARRAWDREPGQGQEVVGRRGPLGQEAAGKRPPAWGKRSRAGLGKEVAGLVAGLVSEAKEPRRESRPGAGDTDLAANQVGAGWRARWRARWRAGRGPAVAGAEGACEDCVRALARRADGCAPGARERGWRAKTCAHRSRARAEVCFTGRGLRGPRPDRG